MLLVGSMKGWYFHAFWKHRIVCSGFYRSVSWGNILQCTTVPAARVAGYENDGFDVCSGCAKTRVPSIEVFPAFRVFRFYYRCSCTWWIGSGVVVVEYDSSVRLRERWFGKSKRGNEHRDRSNEKFDVYLPVYAIVCLLWFV